MRHDKTELALANLNAELREFRDGGGLAFNVTDAILELIDARIREEIESERDRSTSSEGGSL
jgi:hypothetical protein